ncbi:MAG: protein-L-isoaspartate O-methyltransferase family protein [bacterium]
MTNTAIERARFNMIEQQVRPWDVFDQRVLDVLGTVPREKFTPVEHADFALMDTEIPIGHGEYMMPPRLEGRLMQALDIQPGDSVFELGTGSGYLTACMAQLGSHVYSVEIHPDLSENTSEKLSSQGIKNTTLWQGNAVNGWDQGPGTYDAVAITGSLPVYDDRFESMLKIGGRLFIITGRMPVMQAWLITKLNGFDYRREALFETQVNELIDLNGREPFVF